MARGWLVCACCIWLSVDLVQAQMVRNDSIGNDAAKEKLCASRVRAKGISGEIVPFEIDSRYVASSRSLNPDATFIAIDGSSPQLAECFLAWGTGKFEFASSTAENSNWHLIKPKQFEPGFKTRDGRSIAAKVCVKAAQVEINRPNLDHTAQFSAVEIDIGSPLYHPGALIAGKVAERYDIAVKGTSFYKSSGPDLAAVNFTCLLSPVLDVKAIQLK
jgi:hypothetical protein